LGKRNESEKIKLSRIEREREKVCLKAPKKYFERIFSSTVLSARVGAVLLSLLRMDAKRKTAEYLFERPAVKRARYFKASCCGLFGGCVLQSILISASKR
jgi:hypothetical protein